MMAIEVLYKRLADLGATPTAMGGGIKHMLVGYQCIKWMDEHDINDVSLHKVVHHLDNVASFGDDPDETPLLHDVDIQDLESSMLFDESACEALLEAFDPPIRDYLGFESLKPATILAGISGEAPKIGETLRKSLSVLYSRCMKFDNTAALFKINQKAAQNIAIFALAKKLLEQHNFSSKEVVYHIEQLINIRRHQQRHRGSNLLKNYDLSNLAAKLERLLRENNDTLQSLGKFLCRLEVKSNIVGSTIVNGPEDGDTFGPLTTHNISNNDKNANQNINRFIAQYVEDSSKILDANDYVSDILPIMESMKNAKNRYYESDKFNDYVNKAICNTDKLSLDSWRDSVLYTENNGKKVSTVYEDIVEPIREMINISICRRAQKGMTNNIKEIKNKFFGKLGQQISENAALNENASVNYPSNARKTEPKHA